MKAFVTRILRRFGHRPVLIPNGFACAASLLAMAFISPAMPLGVIVVILVAHGMIRSLEFTSLTTLAFADIDRAALNDASTFFNTTMLLAGAAAITVAAMAVHAGSALLALPALAPLAGPGAEYRLAFAIVALVALIGTIDAFRLPHGAGSSLTQ
jgi:hypothetical protein